MAILHTRVATLTERRVSAIGSPSTSRQVALNFTLAALLFLVLAFQLLVRLEILDWGYRVERLRRLVVDSDNTLRELRLEHISHSRPAELSQRAKKELGMVPLVPTKMRQLVRGE